jgi:sterol desaturase/sphingolipid hydroxylase (fatty acid hydroxylase superfamily)
MGDLTVAESSKVDHSGLRTNQAIIILGLLAGFVLDIPLIVAIVAFIMLVGTAIGRPGFFFVYQGILRPLKIARPYVLADNPEPHRFAQGFGGVVAGLAAVLLFLGSSLAGWALAWIVLVLAALNLFLGFCVGCAVYYWLHRLQVPGFAKSPPADTVPGMRPRS